MCVCVCVYCYGMSAHSRPNPKESRKAFNKQVSKSSDEKKLFWAFTGLFLKYYKIDVFLHLTF